MKALWMVAALVLTGCGQEDHASALIIGDSISIGYTPFVTDELSGKTLVQHNPGDFNGNAHDTEFSIMHINEWLADAGTVDVIHANWGLWDMSHSVSGSKQPENCDFSRPPRSSPEQYRANLEALAKILDSTGARIIWATTTPVPSGNTCILSDDVPIYNAILIDVAREHGYSIDDLYTYVLPYAKDLHSGDTSVHFTEQGYQFLSYAVANSIDATGN